MRGMYKRMQVPVLAGLLGLSMLVSFSTPAVALDVTLPGDYSGSSETRFDIKANIPCPAPTYTAGTCLSFPKDAVVFLNGYVVGGPGLDTPLSIGISVGDNSFVWGPGIVKAFGTCITGKIVTGPGPYDFRSPDDVAVEDLVLNSCGTGIKIGHSYKVREVRIHDCTPSYYNGYGMYLGQGGFVESSIIRACDWGLWTGENNKIWNLVVTRHYYTGVTVRGGNAVSRTVVSHPRSLATLGIDYSQCGGTGAGCADASNSVSGHSGTGQNILVGNSNVITQPAELPAASATNCNGVPAPRGAAGLISASC